MHKAVKMDSFEPLNAEIKNKWTNKKSLMGNVLQGYMFHLVADYYGLREKSSKGNKAYFSSLIDWLEKLLG